MIPFVPSRSNGRSDRQVIYDLLQDAEPESLFTYDALERVLSEGLTEPVSRDRIYRAASAGNRTLLKSKQRCLRVVRGTGYRVARADEHLEVARTFETSAQRKIRRGLDVLRDTRIDELTPTQRSIHEGHLLITAGLYQAVQAVSRRQDQQEQVIQGILRQLGQDGESASGA